MTEPVEVAEGCFEFGGKIRAERGHRTVEGVADDATLDNAVTAEHYQLTPVWERDADGAIPEDLIGTPKCDENGVPVKHRDALGRAIEKDKPFTYLDHRKVHGPKPWFLYRLTRTPLPDPKDPDRTVWRERWDKVDMVEGDRAAAFARAEHLLEETT